MPNSFACLMQFTVSAPAFARPTIFAPEACAWSRYDEKSVVPGEGWRAAPSTLPPAALTTFEVSSSSDLPKT